MSDDPLGKSHGVSKFLKERWRSKSNPDKTSINITQDVNDFLRPTSTSNPPPPRPNLPQAPKIDIAAAQRWAGKSAELQSANGGHATPSSLRGRGGSLKKPRRPNLHVGFKDGFEIMGEGGEDCEDPTLEISQALKRKPSGMKHDLPRKAIGSIRHVDNQYNGRPTRTPPPGAQPSSIEHDDDDEELHPGIRDINRPKSNPAAALAYKNLFGEDPEEQTPDKPKYDDDGDNFRPKTLRRTQTGFEKRDSISSQYSDEGSAEGSPAQTKPPLAASHHFQLPELTSKYDSSPIDFGFDKSAQTPTSESAPSPVERYDKIQQMRREEGRMLHKNARRSIVDLADENLSSPPQQRVNQTLATSKQEPKPSPPQFPQKNTPPPAQVHGTPTAIATQQHQRHVPPQAQQRPMPPPSQQKYFSPPQHQQGSAQIQKVDSYESDGIFDMYSSESPIEKKKSPEKPRYPGAPMMNAPVNPAPSVNREPRLPVLDNGIAYQPPIAGVVSPQHKSSPSISTFPQASRNGVVDLRQEQQIPLRQSPTLNASLPVPSQQDSLSTSRDPSPRPTPSPLAIPGKDYISGKPRDPASATSLRNKLDYRAPNTANSVKTPGTALAQVAVEEFDRRCSHMKGIFRLQAEFERPISDYTPSQWLRAAAWWFIKGRSGLEQLIRSRPRTADDTTSNGPRQELLSQPHVDLAKCWWILSDILANHEKLPKPMSNNMSWSARASAAGANKDIESAEFFESCEILFSSLKALLTSMNKNSLMPPENALIQGQDQTIWIPYPKFPADLLPILTGKSRSLTETDTSARIFNPLSVIAVADTNHEFAYFKWFVKVSLSTGNDSEQVSLLCLFSVMRGRNEWHPKVAICTQKELVTICVTGDRKIGPSWEDVKWSEQDTSLQINLPHGYVLNAQLNPTDYQMLASMYKKAYTVQRSLFPLDDEILVYDVTLADFQYNDTLRPPAFPLERTRRCRVRLHMKVERRTEGTGERKIYRGMRILFTSSPKSRTLANTSHELGVGNPIVIEMLTENTPTGESFPAMAVHYKEDHRQCTMFMVFAKLKERQELYSALNQADVSTEEMQYAALRLRKLTIEPLGDYETKGPKNPLGRMQWQELTVINKDPHDPNDDFGQTVLSDDLRIVAQGAGGTITDRINVGPGELRIRVNCDGTQGITVLRQPQSDLTMTVDRRIAPFTPEQAEELHHGISILPTKRTYTFFNADDLHAFQLAITAFKVKFDGLAGSFTISRRRPMTAISKHKKLEANLTRLQVVSHDDDKIVQLLAFFDPTDFSYAESLAFVLKGVDVFERYDGSKGSARFGVRIVDAKFSLPKEKTAKARPEDVERPFVCLDMPDYPGENDDIWIGFDEEADRENFLSALPAVATNHSRGMGGVFGKR